MFGESLFDVFRGADVNTFIFSAHQNIHEIHREIIMAIKTKNRLTADFVAVQCLHCEARKHEGKALAALLRIRNLLVLLRQGFEGHCFVRNTKSHRG